MGEDPVVFGTGSTLPVKRKDIPTGDVLGRNNFWSLYYVSLNRAKFLKRATI